MRQYGRQRTGIITGIRLRLAIFLLAAGLSAPGTALAQTGLDPQADPAYGTATLSTGFVPDPTIVRMTIGGRVDAVTALGTVCLGGASGFIARAPDYRVEYTATQAGRLRFFFIGDADATLVIAAPDGRWYCNNDVLGTNDPMITFETPPSGVYNLWVGSALRADYSLGDLYVTAVGYDPTNFPPPGTISVLPTPIPGSGGGGGGQVSTGGLRLDLSPTYETAVLSGAFAPDPHTVPMITGGSADIAAGVGALCIGEATGWTNGAPSFRMLYSGAQTAQLQFLFSGQGDTTLVINAPDGRWYCDDDSAGNQNPLVAFRPPQEGWYNVWVGSYNAGEFVTGQLYVTAQAYTPDQIVAGTTGTSGTAGSGGSNLLLDPDAAPVYGGAVAESGLQPDPLTVPLIGGGSVGISTALTGACAGEAQGYATGAPTFRLKLIPRGTQVRIFFVPAGGQGDATLAVSLPDRSWACDDDSGGGQDPFLAFQPPQSGWYTIWVGSYAPDATVSGTLYITELPYAPANFRGQ